MVVYDDLIVSQDLMDDLMLVFRFTFRPSLSHLIKRYGVMISRYHDLMI